MKILVTGGAGYIGSVLVRELLKKGCEVVVLDNFSYQQTSLVDLCSNSNFDVINGDVRDENIVGEAIKDTDFIIPLAAIVGAPACEKDKTATKTINYAAINLLLNLRNYKKQRIIFPCTNSGYGIGGKSVYCTERTPINPISYYGQTKVAAEAIVLKDENCISLRLATVFGVSSRMRTDLLVNNFVYRAVKDRYIVLYQANFKRNYIHIQDVARAFIHCIDNFDSMKNQAYNVGLSEANISKLELCQEIKKQIPDFYFHEAEIGEDIDQRDYIVSNEKIEKTGFKPIVSLQEGILELIKAYKMIGSVESQGNTPRRF